MIAKDLVANQRSLHIIHNLCATPLAQCKQWVRCTLIMNKSVPPFRRIGYARVSTVGQTLELQLEQLKAAGCELIFKEKVTGTRADRKELMRLLKTIGPGDQLVVTRIDRLARSVFDLFAHCQACARCRRPFSISFTAHG